MKVVPLQIFHVVPRINQIEAIAVPVFQTAIWFFQHDERIVIGAGEPTFRIDFSHAVLQGTGVHRSFFGPSAI